MWTVISIVSLLSLVIIFTLYYWLRPRHVYLVQDAPENNLHTHLYVAHSKWEAVKLHLDALWQLGESLGKTKREQREARGGCLVCIRQVVKLRDDLTISIAAQPADELERTTMPAHQWAASGPCRQIFTDIRGGSVVLRYKDEVTCFYMRHRPPTAGVPEQCRRCGVQGNCTGYGEPTSNCPPKVPFVFNN